MKRGVLRLAGLAGAAVAAGAVCKRALTKRRERLNVYFDDGSFVTYVEGSREAGQLLPLARQVLAAAHETGVAA